MKKLEKIERQEQKTREKIAALQAILKQIDGARTEQENLQIIQQVRALKLSRDELYAFLGGGVLPATLAGALGADAAEPETIYSRRDKKRKKSQGGEQDTAQSADSTTTEPDADVPEAATQDNYYNGDNDTPNYESEGINHEE